MMDRFLAVFVSFLGLVVLLFGGILIGMMIFVIMDVMGINCKNMGEQLNVPYRYKFGVGCFLKTHDVFVPQSELTFVERDGKMLILPKSQYRIEIDK